MGLQENKRKIMDKLAEGRTREEIFADFSSESPGQEGRIAFSIASIPTTQMHQKFVVFNHLLFSLLVGYSMLILSTVLATKDGLSFAPFLKMVIPLFFAYYVYHFHGGIYRLMAIWCAIELIEAIFKTVSIIQAGVLGVILLLVIFLCFQVFPHFGLFGPKRHDDGRYRLE